MKFEALPPLEGDKGGGLILIINNGYLVFQITH